MKKIFCAVMAFAMVFSASSAAFAGSRDITVILDGTTLDFDVAPQLVNDRTMVPMRAIFEALGASVSWDGDNRKITSVKGDKTVEMTIDDYIMNVNGTQIKLDSAPFIAEGDRTLVPARAVAESFNADVSWIGDSKTVLILNDAKNSLVKAKIKISGYGDIDLALFGNVAPITVENFKSLANSGFYSGLIFHRVIKGFMIQGGGYNINFGEKDVQMIKGEFASNGINNGLKHTRGVISMARQGQDHDNVIAKDSASSQFFIMHEDAPSLDGEYASFGIVTNGMAVVDKIAGVDTATITNLGMSDVPADLTAQTILPIVIESVTIE